MKCIKHCGRKVAKGRTRCLPCLRKQRVWGRSRHIGRNVEVERNAELKKWAGFCSICFEAQANATDHCHRTGKYRSNLCRRCNLVLGFVKDDAALLGRMIAYLKRHHRDEGMSEEAIEILERVIERHENGEDGEWNL